MLTAPAQTAQSEIDDLTDALTGNSINAWDFGTAAVIIAIAIVVARAARFVIGRLLGRRGNNTLLSVLVGRIVSYLILAFALVYALEALGVSIGPILGALGIAGIVLAFALQDIVENFVAGIIVQASRPFATGDEVTAGGHTGVVRSVDARTITIHTPEGDVVKVPSALVIKDTITNHTLLGLRRSTVDVGVAYGTDLLRAQQVIYDALDTLDTVSPERPHLVLAKEFGESSIDFIVLFWHYPTIGEEFGARSDVVFAIEQAFATHGIEIPFPQRTLHVATPRKKRPRPAEPADEA